jgi:hypothetical protein
VNIAAGAMSAPCAQIDGTFDGAQGGAITDFRVNSFQRNGFPVVVNTGDTCNFVA